MTRSQAKLYQRPRTTHAEMVAQ